MINLLNRRFGQLLVVEAAGSKNHKRLWKCLCDCGNTTVLPTYVLTRKQGQKSCGCLQGPWKHGAAGSPTYRSWQQAKSRCSNPNRRSFKDYGGRGITMCRRWHDSFTTFLADMGERRKGTTIERINNDLGYEPGNCRWVASAEQSKNRRKFTLKLIGPRLSSRRFFSRPTTRAGRQKDAA